MLQSDTLANEFNDILNAVEIFAPFQPLDPAVTFYAPLHRTVRDLRLSQDNFQRASDAWYKDGSGIYRNVGINQARFEQNQLLMEAAKTNKQTTYNANDLDPTQNWASADATIEIVNASADLLAAGLADIVPQGNVYELRNDTGLQQIIYLGGDHGNANQHTVSCWMNTFGDDIEYGISGAGSGCFQFFNTSSLEHCIVTCVPDSSARRQAWRLAPGQRCHAILMQTEESPVVTSPIVTEGTAGQRAIDRLEYAGADQFVSDVAGTVLLKWTPEFSDADVNNDVRLEFLGLPGRVRDRWGYFLKNAAGENNFVFYPQTGATGYVEMTTPLQKGQEYKIAYRWGAGFNDSGYYDGGIVWGPLDRDYVSMDPISLMDVVSEPFTGQRVSDIQIFNEKKSRAWIEENFFQS